MSDGDDGTIGPADLARLRSRTSWADTATDTDDRLRAECAATRTGHVAVEMEPGETPRCGHCGVSLSPDALRRAGIKGRKSS